MFTARRRSGSECGKWAKRLETPSSGAPVYEHHYSWAVGILFLVLWESGGIILRQNLNNQHFGSMGATRDCGPMLFRPTLGIWRGRNYGVTYTP
jgi:hypothetical protein